MKKLLFLCLSLAICAKSFATIYIYSHEQSQIASLSCEQLASYLKVIYPGEKFAQTKKLSKADIVLKVDTSMGDGYQSQLDDKQLILSAGSERGILECVYGLLERQGYGFYLSKEVAPEPKVWRAFDESFIFADSPIVGERSLFNWHNFLSGCTGWNVEDWQRWIDAGTKMRYNAVMIHAYANNPIVDYTYLGERKQTGYFNNSASGRDWGNQHVNDVSRLVGCEHLGQIYGSDISKEKEKTRQFMYDVFEFAEQRDMKVIFALDFDTWMAHPKNVVMKLPESSLFNINGNYTPNPEDELGYEYYKFQLRQLLEDYPQIDELTLWSREPVNSLVGFDCIWMNFTYEQFPQSWRDEYDVIAARRTDLPNDKILQSLFAYSKVVKAFQRAAKELGSDVEIGYGSWRFAWIRAADAVMPLDVTIRPLDYAITFSMPINDETYLGKIDPARKFAPVMWAHHDDGSYMGRPYNPLPNLSDKIDERNLSGFGIIHWTTHPLDLYFSQTAENLWQSTRNYTSQQTVDKFVKDMFGSPCESLQEYYYKWFTDGPMFGRETKDVFVDLGAQHSREGSLVVTWEQMKADAHRRLQLLDSTPAELQNDYFKYQRAMEEFYIAFASDQNNFMNSYLSLDSDPQKAIELIEQTTPQATMQLYADAFNTIEATRGEQALLVSMNLRWYTAFLNLRQRLGIEPTSIRFGPTSHDILAQEPGNFTFHVDDNDLWSAVRGAKELPELFNEDYSMKGSAQIPLSTICNDALPTGKYTVTLFATSPMQGRVGCSVGSAEPALQSVNSKECTIQFEIEQAGSEVLLNVDLKVNAIERVLIERVN